MGGDTDYDIISIDGLFSREVALANPDLPRYHGGIVGASYHGPRRVVLTVDIYGGDGEAFSPGHTAARRAFMAAFQPLVDTEEPFDYTLPGEAPSLIFCRPMRGAGQVSIESELGIARFIVVLEATDPAIYGDEVPIVLEPQMPAEGLDYPVTYPKQYGAAGTSGTVFDNTGTWETWPVFQINGPSSGVLTDPVIIAPTLDAKLALTANGGVSIAQGQVLEIGTHPRNRYVRFTTGASRYGKLSLDSEFFALPPGQTELRFQASGTTTGATVVVTARPAEI